MELRFAPESEVAPKLRLGEYHYQHAKDLEDLSCVIDVALRTSCEILFT